MKKQIIIAVALSLALAGCASPTVISARKVGDSGLQCEQITQELAEADRFEAEARGERKVTGTNVLAALFFWPALIVTYSNSEDAINAAKERRAALIKLADRQTCRI